VRGIGIEEAAPVAAQKLDDFLRRYGPAGNRLRRTFERSGFDRWRQSLRHALPNEKESRQHADREQNVEPAANKIDPKIANRWRSSPRKSANERHGDCYSGRGREKRMNRYADHLAQIAHRCLASIGLPARIGDEAHGGIECQIG
jgi:hypothetical protein